MPDSPVGPAAEKPAPLHCCCGRADCSFLKHNCSVLDSVEKDVQAAAKMGQALLARHESYMASAEQDRAELNRRIEQLESDNAALEAKNALTIDENRALLDQLELLNTTVSESEARIRSLEASLRTSQETVQQLESAVDRADEMERHVAVLESEQAALQTSLAESEEETRSAAYRWKQAQRGIGDLQAQVDRMEAQAREDRDRHAEALERLERQRARERELHTAAGRLKGAAAARSMADGGPPGSAVVSHFVRDLLQDNANLQIGIAELREILSNSHDEIQSLREQLYFHQPVADEPDAAASGPPPTLKSELEPLDQPPPAAASKASSQELHVHHHYHVAGPSTPKKPKKKKPPFNPARFSTPDLPAPPPNPSHGWRPSRSCTTPGMLSRQRGSMSASSLSASSTRWSVGSDSQSDLMSITSSPRSIPTNPVFDRSMSSIATSPTTTIEPTSPSQFLRQNRPARFPDSNSPTPLSLLSQDRHPQSSSMSLLPEHVDRPSESESLPSKRPSSGGSHSPSPDDRSDLTVKLTTAGETSTKSNEKRPLNESPPAMPHAYIPRESRLRTTRDVGRASEELPPAEPDSEPEPDTDYFDPYTSRVPGSLRRVVSHESIMSLSNGLDVHTLKRRPSQLALRPLMPPAAGNPAGTTGVSAVTATPTLSRARDEGKRGSVILRDNLTLAGLGLSMPSKGPGDASYAGPSSRSSPAFRLGSSTKAFGKLVFWKKNRGDEKSGENSVGRASDTLSQATQNADAASSSSAAPQPADSAVPAPVVAVTASTPAPPALTITPSGPETLSPPQGEIAATSPARSSAASIVTTVTTTSTSTSHSKQSNPDRGSAIRAPGVNQPGSVPIPGFYEYWAMHQRQPPPSKVSPDAVDREALRDSLGRAEGPSH